MARAEHGQAKGILKTATLFGRVRGIIEAARTNVARSVNIAQVVANWLIGREIVEEEQWGHARAGYGERLLRTLSKKLTAKYGGGFSSRNLEYIRTLYLVYPTLLEKSHALRSISFPNDPNQIPHALRAEFDNRGNSDEWRPGTLHPNLSWTHYRTLLRVEDNQVRAFYEIESIKNNWSARELERQINSLLYERLAKSKDKAGVMRLAQRGHEITRPADIFKDPVVIEFLGLPESHRLVESKLEEALIDNLQNFLLELGRGFAYVARQQRISLEGDHFYIDLVFYHTVLKCYVLIDLKIGKLMHQDLGQLQLYVNYYDRERRIRRDNPTLGLILCTDKNDAVVKYTLGPDQNKTIFASRYRLHLPSESELKQELRREMKSVR
jgi:predicted nuclease of restriction endonuclease-like (RecB) superfamily